MQKHSRQPKVHRFAPEIIARVRRCFQTDNWHGVLELIEDWSVITCATAISLYAWRHLSIFWGIPLYALAAFLIGGRQRGLADVLHQASHRTLVKSPTFGVVLGTVFSGYPLLQSFSGYFSSHVVFHHHYLGDPELDPDYAEYRRRGLCGSNLSRRVLTRYLVRLIGLRSVVGYIHYLLRNRIVSQQEKKLERLVRAIYTLGVLGICIWHGWLAILLMYWLIPLFTTHAWIGAFIELLEHYPLIETAPLIDIYLSRNRECGKLGNFILGIQSQEGYHLVHHRFPQVPRWRQREVHNILMNDPEYAALHRTKGWANILREMFREIPPEMPSVAPTLNTEASGFQRESIEESDAALKQALGESWPAQKSVTAALPTRNADMRITGLPRRHEARGSSHSAVAR